jgi:glycosyltransferase involved in cell wall biosynthesis
MVGEVTGFKRDELFRKADCFILPSHAEGMPITILEAFAVGLPVIATKVGAIPEMIRQEESGLLVDAGDVEGFANALTRLANDNVLCERLGRKGFEEVQGRYGVERWIENLQRIYTEILSEE